MGGPAVTDALTVLPSVRACTRGYAFNFSSMCADRKVYQFSGKEHHRQKVDERSDVADTLYSLQGEARVGVRTFAGNWVVLGTEGGYNDEDSGDGFGGMEHHEVEPETRRLGLHGVEQVVDAGRQDTHRHSWGNRRW